MHGWLHSASPVRTASGRAVSLRTAAHGWFALKKAMLGLPSYIPLIRSLSFNFFGVAPCPTELRRLHPRRIGRPVLTLDTARSESCPNARDPSRNSDRIRPPMTRSNPSCAPASSSPHSSPRCGDIAAAPRHTLRSVLGRAPSPVLTSHLLYNIRPTIATYAVYS
jgi:hypothetical protein